MTEHYDEIHGFSSRGEFDSFPEWLNSAIRSGNFEEIPVESRYGNMEYFQERWFHDFSGAIWRLVSPEPPFMGVFLLVSPSDTPLDKAPAHYFRETERAGFGKSTRTTS